MSIARDRQKFSVSAERSVFRLPFDGDVLVNFLDHVVFRFFDFVLGRGRSSTPRAADVNAASEDARIAISSGLRRLSKRLRSK